MNICLLLEGTGTTSIHFVVATYFVLSTNVLINVALLYMFNRGLWRLRQETLLMVLTERVKSHSDDIETGQVDADSAGGAHTEPTGTSPKLSIQNPETEIEHMSSSKKSILRLHNLIKKQTILVCIATASTCSLAVVSTLDAAGIAVCGWDVMVNTLCVWLMMGIAKEYWNCCSRYGLCRCCYLNDEQNRLMVMIGRTPTSRSRSTNFGQTPTATQMSTVSHHE